MSYEKQGFVPQQVLEAAHMNHIEDGIAAAQEPVIISSTPPTDTDHTIWVAPAETETQVPTYAEHQALASQVASKQDALTFDDTPTANSNNPVKSGGVHTALAGKQDTLTFDSTPTSSSTNPVTSGGVYTALAGKQNTLTFDTTPKSGSSNPVTSSGIHTFATSRAQQIANAAVNDALLKTVRNDTQQSLTSTQKNQARKNIQAAAGNSVAPYESEIGELQLGDLVMSVDGTLGKVTDFADLDDSAIITPTNIANELGDVQEDVDELDERIDAVDERVDSIAIDGSAGPDSLVTIHDAADKMPVEAVVTMDPKQDLHGYTKPWVGGTGKNKLNITAETTTTRGVTFTVNRDSDGNVTSIGIGGTATGGNAYFNGTSAISIDSGTYILTGVTDGSSNFFAQMYDVTESRNGTSQINSNGAEFVPSSDHEYRYNITVISGTTVNAVVYPMLRLASVTDATFEPYSNICPITGYDNVTVTRSGENLFDPDNLVDIRTYQKNGELVGNSDRRGHRFIGGATYHLSVTTDGANTYYKTAKEDGTDVSVSTMIAPGRAFNPTVQKGYYLYVYLEPANVAKAKYCYVGFEQEDATSEPYQGQSVTVNVKAANNNNTVYGGTLTINKDGSGTLVVDRAKGVYNGSESWNFIGTADSFGLCRAYLNGIPNIDVTTPDNQVGNIKSNFFPAGSYNGMGVPRITLRDNTIAQFNIFQNICTNSTDWKAYLSANNLEVVYPLAAPIPYTLTAEQLTTIFGLNHIWSDADSISVEFSVDTMTKIAELNGEVHEELDNLESSVEAQKTSTGNPATVTDAHIAPAGMSVAIEPKQDLHGYEKPWVGGAGKNKLDCPYAGGTVSGVTFTRNDDGTYSLSGTASANIGSLKFYEDNGAFLSPNTQYILSGGNATAKMIIAFSNAATTYTDTGSGVSFTTPNTWTNVWVYPIIQSGANTNGITIEPMIRLATETDPAYEPYSNICPITGYDNVTVTRSGKNLFYPEANKNKWIAQDGAISGTAGAIVSSQISCSAGDAFTVSLDSGVGTLAISFYDASLVMLNRIAQGATNALTATAPENAAYLFAGRYKDSSANIQLELGSTATTYEPYQGQSVTVNVKSANNNNTVYGGMLTINKDGTGTLVVDRAEVDLGDSNWTKDTSGTNAVFRKTIAGIKQVATGIVPNIATDRYFVIPAVGGYSTFVNSAPNGAISMKSVTNVILVRDDRYTTESAFKEAMNGVVLIYELATPTTYTLTASQIMTLLGTNHVWSDAGAVTLDYTGDKYLPADQAVSDVQVNGASVVENGVANIPIMTMSTPGVAKVGNGLYQANDRICANFGSTINAKTGSAASVILPASECHSIAFYGLAKAAGDTTQAASSNEVGTYTDDAKSAIRSMIGAISNTNYANSSDAGVMKIGSGGYGVFLESASKQIRIKKAPSTDIKAGSDNYEPIVCANQHEAAFYGLAKAAGDTTQAASSNAVGTYTSEAKTAIRTMLGVDAASIAAEVDIPLIETVTGTTPVIVGQPNVRYVCGEVSTITITPPSSGSVDVIFESGSTPTVMTVPSTVKWPAWFDATALLTETTYEILITDGVYGSVMTWAT